MDLSHVDWVLVGALAANAIVTLIGIVVAFRTRHDVVQVKKSTDGLTTALVKSSRQEGFEEARLQGEDRAAVLKEGQRQGREESKPTAKRGPRKGTKAAP